MSRALWGKAKLDIYAFKNDILSLHQQGQNLEEIFNNLSARLAVGKRTFKRHASAIIKAAHQSPKAHYQPGSTHLVSGMIGTPSPTPPAVDTQKATERAPNPVRKPAPSPRPPSHSKSVVKPKFNHNPTVTPELLDELWGTKSDDTSKKETSE